MTQDHNDNSTELDDELDRKALENARDVVKKRFPEMVKGYLEDADKYIEKIRQGVLDNDAQEIAQNAHPLKSASFGLGVNRVASIAKDIEQRAKDAIEQQADIDDLQELLAGLENALARVRPRLENELPND